MKYHLILLAGLSLAACDSTTTEAPAANQAAAPAATESANVGSAAKAPSVTAPPEAAAPAETALESPEQRLGYAVGLQVGGSLAERGFDGDLDALVLGLKDAFSGTEPRVSIEELQAAMVAARERAEARDAEEAAAAASAGKAFMDQKKGEEGVQTTESGLMYKVINPGTGANPKLTDTVSVHYRGTLINGEEFDSSYGRGEPATFPVNGVIQGWQEVLPLMKEGAKWEVYIPAELAYGERGAGGVIGPNETLVFEIELLGIGEAKAEAQPEQPAAEAAQPEEPAGGAQPEERPAQNKAE